MNKIDEFVIRAGTYMAADRPDIWDVNQAKKNLYRWIDYLFENDAEEVGSGGFVLSRSDVDGVVEYRLSRSVIDYSFFLKDQDEDIYDWTSNSNGFN